MEATSSFLDQIQMQQRPVNPTDDPSYLLPWRQKLSSTLSNLTSVVKLSNKLQSDEYLLIVK